jgi:hypothetical protein
MPTLSIRSTVIAQRVNSASPRSPLFRTRTVNVRSGSNDAGFGVLAGFADVASSPVSLRLARPCDLGATSGASVGCCGPSESTFAQAAQSVTATASQIISTTPAIPRSCRGKRGPRTVSQSSPSRSTVMQDGKCGTGTFHVIRPTTCCLGASSSNSTRTRGDAPDTCCAIPHRQRNRSRCARSDGTESHHPGSRPVCDPVTDHEAPNRSPFRGESSAT